MAAVADEYAAGFAGAALSPLFCAVGITIWDKHWFGSGGHAYMLNIFKGLTMGFLFAIWTAAGFATGVNGCWSVGAVAWLCLSSVIGIVVGDTLWLFALERLGAREMILIDSLKPFLFALFAFGILREDILWPWWVGCVITTGSIVWVSNERERAKRAPESSSTRRTARDAAQLQDGHEPSIECSAVVLNGGSTASGQCIAVAVPSVQPVDGGAKHDSVRTRRRRYIEGWLAAASNVLFDQLGAVVTKRYASEMQTWEINLVRFGFAAICLLVPLCFRAGLLQACAPSGAAASRIHAFDRAAGHWHKLPTLGSKRAWAIVLLGCLSTTLACPILSTWSLFRISTALYGVLTSTGPIYALFVVRVIKGERSTARAWCGGGLAVLGVALLACQSQLVALTQSEADAARATAPVGEALVRFCTHTS